MQEAAVPFMDKVVPYLTTSLVQVARNPNKPHFNHYLFESISLCIKIMCKSDKKNVSQFEASLFPIFQGILQQDVTGNLLIFLRG